MLKLRILTAVILIPLVFLAVFFLKQPYFALVCAIIVALAAWEWARLCGWIKTWQRLAYAALIIVALPLAAVFPVTVVVIGAIWWLGAMYWILQMRKKIKPRAYPHWFIGLLGFLALAPFWEALQILSHKRGLLLYLLILVWLADTGAYFGGRLMGRRKLAPGISPNKTVEGLATAVGLTFLLSLALDWFWLTPQQLQWNWLLPPIATVMAAIVGDLFESLLKRQQGLKDSGRLLPGHGGVLDRLDSIIAAAPIFACGVLGMNLLN